jgi:hypothetical protein
LFFYLITFEAVIIDVEADNPIFNEKHYGLLIRDAVIPAVTIVADMIVHPGEKNYNMIILG